MFTSPSGRCVAWLRASVILSTASSLKPRLFATSPGGCDHATRPSTKAAAALKSLPTPPLLQATKRHNRTPMCDSNYIWRFCCFTRSHFANPFRAYSPKRKTKCTDTRIPPPLSGVAMGFRFLLQLLTPLCGTCLIVRLARCQAECGPNLRV